MNLDGFLPAPPVPPVTLAGLVHNVRAFILRYVHMTTEQATLLALWVAMTHAIDAFDYTAYVHVTSPVAECGKSRLLEVLATLVANPWLTSRVTAAVLMRKVDKEHPVLLLDESDAAFNSDEQYAEALRGMLNAGFHRKGRASVCVGQGANLTYKDFSVFGPKVIAGIGRLPSTVESRSIPITMKRRTKGEPIHKWRDRAGWDAAADLREPLIAALVGRIDALKDVRPEIPDGLSDRTEDVLEPLFAIADLAGGEWPKSARAAAVALMGQAARAAREADQQLPLELLTDLRPIVDALPDKQDAVTTKTLLEKLVALDDRPWAALGRNEKPLTGHRLARLLKPFEIEPAGTVRIGDLTGKGYRRVVFEDAFLRYLGPKASQRNDSNESGPESPKTNASQTSSVTVQKTAIDPDKHWVCSDVTLSNPDHEDNGCCEGGPLEPRCKLCRQSPTYWRERPQ